MGSLLRRLKYWIRLDRLDAELAEEMEFHRAMRQARLEESGLPPHEAALASRRAIGNLTAAREDVRDVWIWRWTDDFVRDLRHGARLLRRSPGFTLVAVLSLALGIGANSAIFSVVDTVVFRQLPYKDPGRLVKIWGKASARQREDVSLPDFLDIRDQNHVFEQLAADDGTDFTITHPDGSRESVDGALVTAGWLPTLGVQPILGRGFVAEEERPGGNRVVILTHAYWQRRFGSDPNIIGQTLNVDGSPVTVIGVLPPNVLRYGADFLQPLVAADYPAGRSHRDLDVFARLKPGVTLAQAQAEIETIGSRLEREYPATNKGRGFTLVPLGKYYASIQRKADQGLLLMLGAVALVLLIACANVASLLLARAATRYRECVIRAAVGASRTRLVRQMLVESALLLLLGGALGVLLARWSVDSLLAFAVVGNYVPERMAVALDGRVLAFSLLVSLLSGVLFGLAPALQASRVALNDGLRTSSATPSGGLRRNRRLLIVSELALSLVLLVGSGLLIRSFVRVHATSGGIESENLLETAADGGRSFPQAVAFWRAVLEQTRGVPGVQFAAVTSRPPVHGARRQRFVIDGRSRISAGEETAAGDILISPDYFRTMGIPLVKGRAFTEKDNETAPPVAIISQSLARQYFPDQDPLGRHVSVTEHSPMTCCSTAGPVEGVWREIIGIVGDVRQANLDEPPAVTFYRPYSQIVEHDMFLMVRAESSSDAIRIAANLRSHLRAVDPGKQWPDVRSMRNVIDGSESIRLRRFVLILLGSFAGLALLLAAVGTYGVMAYSVVERTREIGIRVALGATSPTVLKQVLGETVKLTIGGLVVGALAAQGLTRFISTMLFGVSATDAVTYLGVSFLLATVALLASYVPARRATRIDPMVALRQE